MPQVFAVLYCKRVKYNKKQVRNQCAGGQAGGVLQTLQWGLAANDIEVLQCSLDALAALMRAALQDKHAAGCAAPPPP